MDEITKQRPDNYLVWAVLSTVLCCVPIGVVAVTKSMKVDTLWNDGRYDEAIQSAKSAKKWAIIAVVSAFVLIITSTIFYTLFIVIVALASQ